MSVVCFPMSDYFFSFSSLGISWSVFSSGTCEFSECFWWWVMGCVDCFCYESLRVGLWRCVIKKNNLKMVLICDDPNLDLGSFA